MPESDFTPEERAILQRYFTNVDEPVFGLINLPEVVKGALFARYSRSPKSLRRLFLDEFYKEELIGPQSGHVDAGDDALGVARAEELYERVLVEYGEDSVAQLAGAHIAIEDASNVLTKVIEWGRLMAYLEQSTRYIPYNTQRDGRWRYHVPAEITDAALRQRFVETMDLCFETYAAWFPRVEERLREQFPKGESDSKTAYRQSIRAKACDILRGLLPAATTANVGVFGTAQAFESLLLRLQEHPLAEARAAGVQALTELRKVIPVFMRRIDREDRGVAWSRYMHATAARVRDGVARILPQRHDETAPYVRLTEHDADGETKVVASAIYPHADITDEQVLAIAQRLSADERAALLRAYIGERTNRRHKPGRAFERTSYRFDVVVDYGAFRDLQRHRLMTLDWQPLSPHLGYDVPDEAIAWGMEDEWRRVMRECAALYDAMRDAGLAHACQYAVPMAYRIRFYMDMNARQAMHLIELRSSQQGHKSYRWVAQEMLREIRETAGHHAIADAMIFVELDASEGLERLEAERAKERRIAALG
jgi:thymidylate synthase ThyX